MFVLLMVCYVRETKSLIQNHVFFYPCWQNLIIDFFWGAVSSKLNIYPEAVGSKSKKVQTFLKQVYANWKFFNHKQLQFLGFLLTDCKVKLGFEIYSGVGNKIEKLGP